MRIEFAGAVYHLTARGNEKKRIFLDDQDRKTFLKVIGQVKSRFHWLFHSYVLMGNHYHLLVETPEANLSRGMRQLNGVYTREFNKRHGRTGHLFQGRFSSILIDKDDYLLEVCRYIALNPVRANMAGKAEEWGWGSYRALIGMDKAPTWLETDWILGQFGGERRDAIAALRRYTGKGVGGEYPTEELRGGWILGNDRFMERIQGLIREKEQALEMPREQRHVSHKGLDEIFLCDARRGASRDESIYRAYVDHGYTMREIAEYLDLHYVSVSRAIRNFESKVKK
jgi:putative transposase